MNDNNWRDDPRVQAVFGRNTSQTSNNQPINLPQLLRDCAEKLRLCRTHHGGVYVGGVEYIELQKRIAAALEQVSRGFRL